MVKKRLGSSGVNSNRPRFDYRFCSSFVFLCSVSACFLLLLFDSIDERILRNLEVFIFNLHVAIICALAISDY